MPVKEIDLKRRYWVFAFYDCYPCGGLGDVERTFDIEQEAIAFCKTLPGLYDNGSVFDTELRIDIHDF